MLYNSLNLSQLVEFFVKVDPIQEITPITQDKIRNTQEDPFMLAVSAYQGNQTTCHTSGQQKRQRRAPKVENDAPDAASEPYRH